VELAHGTYYTDAPIDFDSTHNGKRVRCLGVATWIPTYTSVAGADVRDNAVFRIKGVDDVAESATVGKTYKASETITFGSAFVDPGTWVRVYGVNAQYDFPFDSADVTVSEIVETESNVGAVFATTRIMGMWHSATLDAVAVAPVIDFELEGIYVDADGNDSIAVGFLVESSSRITLRRCGGRNLSRFVINGWGSKHCRDFDCYSRGSSNGGILWETCQDFVSQGYRRTGEGARTHVNGVPRHELMFRAMTADSLFTNFDVNHASGLCRAYGGVKSGFRNGRGYDLNVTELIARDPYMFPMYGMIACVGVVFDGGAGEVAFERVEFGIEVFLENVHASECYQPYSHLEGGGCCAFYFHDHTPGFRAINVSVANQGRGPLGANAGPFKCGGIIGSDCAGQFSDIYLKGTEYCLLTRNAYFAARFDGLEWVSFQGDSTATVPAWAFAFGHAGSDGRAAPTFRRVQIGGTSEVYRWCRFIDAYITGNPGSPDLGITFHDVMIEGFRYEEVQPVPATGDWGSICNVFLRYDSGGSAALWTSATSGVRNAGIACSYPHNGFGMMARRGCLFKVNGAPVFGETLLPDSIGMADDLAIPASPGSYGVTLQKASSNMTFAEIVRQ